MPERVVSIAEEVARTVHDKVRRIGHVTDMTKLLSINALIEAARAGDSGQGFAAVAQEVSSVSDEIRSLSESLTLELAPQLDRLDELGQQLVQQVRGGRLADLSLGMIDVIDRNLYERSCDVRWWATDVAMVDACTDPNEATSAYASRRLGVILDSYTVYLDLWVVDLDGRVIANGRPQRYPSALGRLVRDEQWFRGAVATGSGEDYVVADVDTNAGLGDATVATYATAIREGGEADGRVIGALGVFFDWEPQARGILQGVRLTAEERRRSRCLLIDSNNRVLASSDGYGVLRERYPLRPESGAVGYYTDEVGRVIGYALTPGYETYRGLGWFGVIEQLPPTTAGAG